MFDFKKKELNVAISMVLALSGGLFLAGCDTGGGDTSTSTSTSTASGVKTEVRDPTGSVQGVVMDTNGNFISGAKVIIGEQSVTTNEGGQYYFAKVQPVHAQSTDTAVVNPPITVSVIGPEGYLSATVAVTPSAQIDGNADTGAGAPGNPVTTFIDGFVAQATPAILPKLGASVNGVIRNILTGEPIGNTRVSLDMTAIAGGLGNTLAGPNGNLSFQTGAYNVMTDESGKFEIVNLPEDSVFNIYVAGYNNAGQVPVPPAVNIAATVTTQEDETVNMGNVFVTPIVANDVIPPTVLSTTLYSGVPQMAGTCPGPAVAGLGLTPVVTMPELKDGVNGSDTNPIKINFSERMVNGGADKVYVRQWIPGKGTSVDINVASVTMGADSKSVSLVLADPLPMGPTRFDVMFVRDAWTDVAGNPIGVTTDPITVAAVTPSAAPYDALGPNTATVILEMCTFKDVNAGTPGTLVQSSGGEAAEDQDNDYVGVIEDHSQNLDSSDTYAPTAGPRFGLTVNTAMDRLDELEDARGGAFTHDSNTARLIFTAGNATNYSITIVRTAADVTKFGAVPAGNVTVFDDLNIQQGVVLSSGNNLPPVINESVYSINLAGVVPGDTVSIQPTDAFGYPLGEPAVAVLTDNTRPTTVLQHAYRDDNAETTAPAVVATTGDGGELAWEGQVPQIGIPLLPITPHLIDVLDANGENIVDGAGRVADRSLSGELFSLSKDGKTDDGATWAGVQTYDTTAFNAMTAGQMKRTIGVAFSENIVLSGQPAESTSAGFDSCVAQNDTIVRVNEALVGSILETGPDGNPTNERLDEADLARCLTGNVLTLANVDHGQPIDFNGVVEDSAGNKTTDNSRAQVVIQDDMPPFMTFAAFDGQVLNLKFNEPVSIANNPRLTFSDPTGVNLPQSLALTAANTAIDSSGMSLSVTPAGAGQSAGILLAMVDVPSAAATENTYVYVEDGAYYQPSNYTNNRAPQANARLGHGILDYSDIQDARGNSWADWIDTNGAYADPADQYSDLADTTDINRRVEFTNPRFAVVDALGRFESTITVDGYQTTQDTTTSDQTVTIRFSHPVEWGRADGLDSNNDGSITLAELRAFYKVGAGGVQQFEDNGTAANDLVTISPDRRTLTLLFRTALRVTNNNDATLSLQNGKFFTSALLTADRDGGTSTVNPGADGVFDPQTVYGSGTSISPKL